MCDPVTIAGTALSVAGSVVGYEGQVDATNAANAQAAAAHRNAGLSATNQYGDAQRKYEYEAKTVQQQGYDAVMAGRAAVASGIAAAGSSGVDAGSVSIADILNEQRRMTAQNLSNVKAKQSDMAQAFVSEGKAIEQQAQGRIDSTPFQAGPSKLGLMIDVGKAGFDAYQSYKKGQ